MDIIKEALRYIGYRGEPDAQTAELLEKGKKELEGAVSPAFCFALKKKSECGNLLPGSDIAKHLAGCESVIFFAATLGAGADRVIRAAESVNMAYALILDALASSCIEQYCDECEKKMHEKTGENYTSRFSAGYGDYPISVQGDLICLLGADKRIGLTATENHILIPRKSVTAVIGVSSGKTQERKISCDSCNMRDRCIFRKEGTSCGR